MRVFACKNTEKKYFSLKMYALALRHCGDFSKINMHRSAFSYKKKYNFSFTEVIPKVYCQFGP